MPTNLYPLCSNLFMMSAMRPRFTPSGLIMMNVLSLTAGALIGYKMKRNDFLSQLSLISEHRFRIEAKE